MTTPESQNNEGMRDAVKFAHTGLVWIAICRVIVVLRLRFLMLYARYVGHVISGQSLTMLTMLTPGTPEEEEEVSAG